MSNGLPQKGRRGDLQNSLPRARKRARITHSTWICHEKVKKKKKNAGDTRIPFDFLPRTHNDFGIKSRSLRRPRAKFPIIAVPEERKVVFLDLLGLSLNLDMG